MAESITTENIDLTGQVAIVTGGGRGIGRAIALVLAQAGAKVAVAARSADQLAETVALIEEAGGQGLAVPTDVTDQHAVERMVMVTEQQLGPVDLLVNNAGVRGPAGPMWETDPDEWWHVLEVDLRGLYLCSSAVLPSMIARGQGRIVTVSSGAGNWGSPYNAAYCISKCAATRFSEILASETKGHAISVFSMHPGFVRTDMTEEAAASSSDARWVKVLRKALARGRDVPPQRAAELTLFLASGQADALSGCYFSIGYDVIEMVERAEEIQKKQLYTLRLQT